MWFEIVMLALMPVALVGSVALNSPPQVRKSRRNFSRRTVK